MKIQLMLISIILIISISSIMTADDSASEQISDFPEVCETGSRNGDWKDCANTLSKLIWHSYTWYDNQPMIICKLKCTRKLNGRVSNYQWVWDAKFACEDQAPGIIGEARGYKIRRMAMQHAIAQTIEQAMTFGKLVPDDFKCN